MQAKRPWIVVLVVASALITPNLKGPRYNALFAADPPAPAPKPPEAENPNRPVPRGGRPSYPSPAGGREPIKRSEVISMTFEKADIVAVLKLLGQAAGVTMAISPQVQGTITVTSTGDVPIAEAFDIINSILRVRGFTMIGTPRDKVIQVVPIKEAVTTATRVGTGADESQIQPGDQLLTQIVPLKNADASKLKSDLAPLLSKENSAITSNSESNTLVITDTQSNVKRMLSVIKELDRDVSTLLTMEVINLQHANAEAIAEMLNNLFEEKRPGGRGGAPQMPQPDGGQPKVAIEKGFVELRGQVKVTAESRTNSLVVSASKDKMDLIKGLIEKLDVDLSPDVKVKVYPLENADATSLAEELNLIFEQPQGSPEISSRIRMPWEWRYPTPQTSGQKPGFAGLKENTVIPDVRTNALIVTARAENMEAFDELIENLDRERSISEVTHVYRLVHAKAADIAQTLTDLFQGGQRGGGFFSFLFRMQTAKEGPLSTLREVTVVAEPKSNSVIVTGPPQVFDTITQLMDELDKQQSQVFIEVLIVDVTLDKDTQLGVEWDFLKGNTVKQTGATNFDLASRTNGLKYTVAAPGVAGLLQTLIEEKKVKVISTPHLTTMDNVESYIDIGQRFPVVKELVTQPNGQVIPKFDFEPISIKLTVTPHITTGKFITMDIEQTIDDLQKTIKQQDFELPIIENRKAKTSVMVEDGQTIIIGGIMKDKKTVTERKLPILGDLPIVGNLFKDNHTEKITSELMVFLTPHVITTQEDANQITQQQKSKLRKGVLPAEKSKKR